jgi:hypothetical protein
MGTGDDKPELHSDELITSTDLHQVLRCTRGDETRIYGLRVVCSGAELWRVTECPGAKTRSGKESDVKDPDKTSLFLEEVRRTLKAGGWQET